MGTEHEITSTTGRTNTTPKSPRSRSKSLPRGNYTFIGIDIDTTGKRLIDEIVQIAAHSSKSEYAQYIMPYMNLNPAARQRHQVRVITIGFFRMLKSMQTYKILKTKSEVFVLTDFLDWLDNQGKADENSLGVILIYHEERKFIPYMLLDAFKKYNLLNRFLGTVRAFANGFDLAETKCSDSIKCFSLRQLSNTVLLKNKVNKKKCDFEGNASVRARLAYDIIHHLAKEEVDDQSVDLIVEKTPNAIYEFSDPVSHVIAELRNQKKILDRQNSLRPIFLHYFKTTLFHRVKAVTYRRVLAENNLDLEILERIWNAGKKANISKIIEKLENLKPEEKIELVDLLDCHFDPEKSPKKPVVKSRSKKRSYGRRRGLNNENAIPSNGQKVQVDLKTKPATKKNDRSKPGSHSNNTTVD